MGNPGIPAAVESVAAEQEVVRGQATINTQTTPEVSQDGQEQTHQVQASQMSITGAGPDLTNGNLGTVTQQDEVTQGESQRGTQRPCDQNNVNLPMQSQNGEERLRTDTYRIPPDTVSGYLASQGPGMEQNPGAALKEMGVKRERPNLFRRFIDHLPYRREKLQEYISEYEPTAEELEVLANDPRFPYRPSDLFLKIYATMVRSLEQDILGGVVSPELMSGSGVVTHTVFGSIPEIMSHCAKAIEHAEEEVIIATAYWQKGDSVNKVRDALIELNRKASERTAKGGSEKVIVKILYDRSHFVKKMVTPGYRIKIDPSEHTSIDLPDVKDVPNLSIEIVDYHRPFLGTLHTKYIILDRKIAFLMSNNIQDRPNLEFCMQLEGPIVDSLYDMFLISWDRPFDPPLPKINKPAGNWPEDTFGFVDQPNTLGVIPKGQYEPYLHHRRIASVPMALCNRNSHGTPGHKDIVNPQGAAWISAFRYAEKEIYMQSPTLNAKPALRGIVDAIKRGVNVKIGLTLGFNDKTEGNVPFQGGTNKTVVNRLKAEVKELGREKQLRVFWFVGKGQTKPIQRIHCHTKFMAIDRKIVIAGNGNMDTQSWLHSEEINVIVDSEQITEEWLEALHRNQDTFTVPLKEGEIDNSYEGLQKPSEEKKKEHSPGKESRFQETGDDQFAAVQDDGTDPNQRTIDNKDVPATSDGNYQKEDKDVQKGMDENNLQPPTFEPMGQPAKSPVVAGVGSSNNTNNNNNNNNNT